MKSIIALALLCLALAPVLYAEQAAKGDKPSISTTQAGQLTAKVVELDRDSRQITLRGPEGGQRSIKLGDAAQRLDEVEVGDTVMVEFVQHLSVEVHSGDNAKPGLGIAVATVDAPVSGQPGMAATETTVSTAVVQEIDLEHNTFKLKWAEHDIRQYEARDPANLRKASVGDLVVVTHTESLAVQLQELPPGS